MREPRFYTFTVSSGPNFYTEDVDGTGFVCDEYYQIYLDERSVPLNSDANLVLDMTDCQQVRVRASARKAYM